MDEMGLDIADTDFKNLNQKTQVTVLYCNLIEIKSLVKNQNKLINQIQLDKKLHRKIIYAWLAGMTAIVGSLLGVRLI